MENKYFYMAPDGRAIPVTSTWVYLATDGQYYPAPAGSVVTEGDQNFFMTEQGRVPVIPQYVYYADNGLPTAAPPERVYVMAAGADLPVAVASGAPQNGYAAPLAEVEAQGGKGSRLREFRRSCERVGGSMLLYLLISTIASTVVLCIFTLPMIVEMATNPETARVMMEALASGSGNVTEMLNAMSEYMPKQVDLLNIGIWAATIVGAVLASILPMQRVAKKSGFKPGSVFAKSSRIKGIGLKGYLVAMGITSAWTFIYAFIISLVPQMQEGAAAMEMPENLVAIILYCAYVCIGAPILEEFIFRGVIFKSLSRYGVVFAAVVNSILFGLLHGNLQQAPFAILIGLVFSYVALRTGSIRLPILLHFGVNAFSTLVNVLYSYIFPEQGELINSIYLVICVLFVIAGIVVAIIQRRKAHKKSGKTLSWVPENPESCATILPYEGEGIKAKGFHFATCGLIILFVGYCLFSIVTTMGVL